ncbi:MAG: hypothetical protein IKB68_05885 [Rikenellaceae bacterium]|nr:hypothetical protein [Rikenellaceae bacterium]
MKKGWVFLLGFISGVAFLFIVSLILASNLQNNGMTFFEKEGECISRKPFQVMQVIGDGYALAYESDYNYILETYIHSDLLALVTNLEGDLYYDEQIIKVPQGKCFKQIGIYKYKSKGGEYKTIPIIRLSK